MGSGTYSSTFDSSSGKMKFDSSIRDMKYKSRGVDLDTVSRDEMFVQKQIHNSMNPNGIKIRESRDSEEHPTSIAIIMGLDVTGSMMGIPHYLVTEGLPKIMGKIIQKGIEHPQMLFMGIGDHECDRAPLQVGQFESSDDLLDKWLTDVYLEGGGGGNSGESYLLAWYFAANHTSIDCQEKGRERGILITIGDEPCLTSITGSSLKKIMGEGQFKNTYTAKELLEIAKEKYNVYHINVAHNGRGVDKRTTDQWKDFLNQNLIIVKTQEEIADAVADIVIKNAIHTHAAVVEANEEIKTEDGRQTLL